MAGVNVAMYRNRVKIDETTVGMRYEYARIHYLNSAILPAETEMEDHSGSLVNLLSLGFIKQV